MLGFDPECEMSKSLLPYLCVLRWMGGVKGKVSAVNTCRRNMLQDREKRGNLRDGDVILSVFYGSKSEIACDLETGLLE